MFRRLILNVALAITLFGALSAIGWFHHITTTTRAPDPIGEMILEFTPEVPLPQPRPIPKVFTRAQLEPHFDHSARTYRLSSDLLARVAYQESRFRPAVCSKVGACGIMQLMPATAERFGVNRFDPVQAIYGGAQYLAILHRMFEGNTGLALAGYNWGEGNVQRWLISTSKLDAVPEETREYVKIITGRDLAHWLRKPSARKARARLQEA